MRKVTLVVILMLTAWLALPSMAQHQFMRGNCMPDSETAAGDGGGRAASRAPRHLPTPKTTWDSERTYPVAVVLMEAKDTTFSIESPNEFYQRLFNERGFNQGNGMGCVADYFRDQSNGLLNLEFHIYGPVKVSFSMRPSDRYGINAFREAMQQVIAANPDVDYKQYDWDGNGVVEQVVFVYAGFGGNESNAKAKGCIWPNTSTFATVTTPDGVKIYNYTASAELWAGNSQSCGIGTICHEFSHSLGLPDIYPVGDESLPYSMLDEWDLMDGGNFTNWGWCPPNMTPQEKMLLGWLTATELTEAMSVRDMKPSADGGEVYQIKHTDKEYLLLENRQWNGWDAGLPGKGLVIYHVDIEKWRGNGVNSSPNRYGYQLVYADNMDYGAWENYVHTWERPKQYANSSRMNSNFLRSASYPWATDSTEVVNRGLTDTSVPAAQMYTANDEGSLLLGKPITNITMTDDGFISFDFMGGDPGGIDPLGVEPAISRKYYNLQGQQVHAPRKGIYVVNRKKVIIH